MASISMKELLEAGVHFGHRTNRWNPKMKRYIYGGRNGIYIIDLHQTLKLFEEAREFIQQVALDNKPVLFVGTKKQAQDAVEETARACRQYWVNQRWLGGMLTNYRTIKDRIDRLRELTEMETEGQFDRLPKKEATRLREEQARLERNLGGIKDMPELPGAVFIVDLKKERIALQEARKLEIPVVAIVDTNCDPDEVDWVIPGNDDAIRAIRLMCEKMSEAIIEVKQIEWQGAEVVQDEEAEGGKEAAESEESEDTALPPTKDDMAAFGSEPDKEPETLTEDLGKDLETAGEPRVHADPGQEPETEPEPPQPREMEDSVVEGSEDEEGSPVETLEKD